MDNKKRISVIWKFAKKHIPLFIIAEICILVTYAVALLLPMNLKVLVDDVLYGEKDQLLGRVIVSYILLYFISTAFNMIYAYVWQTLNNRFVVDVKTKVYEKAVFAKARFLANMNSGDMMSRIDGDADQFINIVQRNLFHFINSALLCIGIIYMVARINIAIAVILVMAALLPIVFTRLIGRRTERYSRKERELSGEFTGRFFEILKGMREIRLFSAFSFIENRIFTPLKSLIKLGNKLRALNLLSDKVTSFINLLTSLAIYGFSAYLIFGGNLTIGLFIAIIEYVSLLHRKFNWMLKIYLDWFSRKVNIDRVNEILECDSEDSGGMLLQNIEKISFENASFSYGKNKVLNKLNFTVKAGEKVAVVGTSGVGKTTLIGLIMKFYSPQDGVVKLNGINIEDISYSSLRSHIGFVSQDIQLFDDSIRFNITLGMNNVPDDSILEICGKVGLLELINTLPFGLDTQIGAGKDDLSGGQKQRIMLVRLLLKGTQTIILDEATSALDSITEKEILHVISALENKTIIIISHRYETVKSCSKIIVLDGGEIKSIGTDESLMESCSAYKSMFIIKS